MIRSKRSWELFPKRCAKDAHENCFSSRCGSWYFEDRDVVVIYNNHPYAVYPERRDEELVQFRNWLRAEGIQELSFATYPETGYSYAIILDVSKDRETFVVEAMREIMLKVLFPHQQGPEKSPETSST